MPILIEIQKNVKCYLLKKGHQQTPIIDAALHYTKWPHPANVEQYIEKQDSIDYTVKVYTDGSKGEFGVGSGIAVFIENDLTNQLQYKLHDKCTNNQAEQLAILKALELIESISNIEERQKTAAIHTDSKITLDSLQNTSNHNNLVEKIRQQTGKLKAQNWTIHYTWIKAHAGNFGNELADHLAKAAARNNDLQVCYDRIPTSELEEDSVVKWNKEWQACSKGEITKSYFPSVHDRLKVNIPLTRNVTTFLTGHGRLRSYFHRFHIMDSPLCPCGSGEQTIDHLIFECTKLDKNRSVLRNTILMKRGQWPNTKRDLIHRYKRDCIKFIESIDLELL